MWTVTAGRPRSGTRVTDKGAEPGARWGWGFLVLWRVLRGNDLLVRSGRRLLRPSDVRSGEHDGEHNDEVVPHNGPFKTQDRYRTGIYLSDRFHTEATRDSYLSAESETRLCLKTGVGRRRPSNAMGGRPHRDFDRLDHRIGGRFPGAICKAKTR